MKVAVVGVGRWGVNHVRVLCELSRAVDKELEVDEVIVVDKDLARARHVAKRYGASRYLSDLSELINSGVDAAIVAVPTVYHYEVAMKLLPHMDVLVEKPIAAKLEEAEEMARTAEREGRLLAVGHIERFNPVVPALKDKLASEEEEVIHVIAQRVGPGPAKGYTLNLGVAHDLLVHDVDVICYLLNSLPSSVFAKAFWEPGYEYETEVIAMYTFEELGVTAELRASWRASPRFKRRTISIQLRSKLIEADYILQTIRVERGLVEHRSRGEYSELISAYTSRVRETWSMLGIKREPLLLEDAHFLRCVARGEKPLNSWEVGLRALKCVLAALDSARSRTPISIEWEAQ